MAGIFLNIRDALRRARPIAWRTALVCGVAATLAGCAWLDQKQRELVLRPTPGRPADFTGLRAGDESFRLDVPGRHSSPSDQVLLWWLPNADPHAPALLYLHGTFRNLYQNRRKVDALRDAGFSVLAVEYRGWGDSTRILPSEASIYADAAVAWRELVRRAPDPQRRVIFGHSMGTGVAVELASRQRGGVDYGGLILESAFTRLPDVAKEDGIAGTLVSWFATLDFDSIAKIGRVDAPILMLHGSVDRTVPIVLGRRLYAAAPPGTLFVEFAGGSHSGLDRESPALYRIAMHQLIDQLARR